jgi:hypothetical protein
MGGQTMFEQLTQFITKPAQVNASITSQKFERFRRVCAKKTHTINRQNAAPSAEFKETFGLRKSHHVLETDHYYEPSITYPPESLLEKGTAERFLSCKLSPLDEFKLKRESRLRESTLSGTIARFKTKKKKSA